MIVEKANNCLFSLLKKSKEWRGFDPDLILYLFDHLIAPMAVKYGKISIGTKSKKYVSLYINLC